MIWGPHLIDQTLLLFGIPDRRAGNPRQAAQKGRAERDDFFQLVPPLRLKWSATLGAGSLVSGGQRTVSPCTAREGERGESRSRISREDQLKARRGVPGLQGLGTRSGRPPILYEGACRHHAAPRGGNVAIQAAGYYVALRESVASAERRNPVPPEQGATTMSNQSRQRCAPTRRGTTSHS